MQVQVANVIKYEIEMHIQILRYTEMEWLLLLCFTHYVPDDIVAYNPEEHHDGHELEEVTIQL